MIDAAAVYVAQRVDADNRVCVDAPCVNCGYNLRSLLADAVCTECAHPVRLSIGGELLRFASPRWVRSLARGAMAIIIALVVWIGGGMLISMVSGVIAGLSVPSFARGGTPSVTPFLVLNVIQQLLYAVIIGIVMYGVVKMTTREPTAGSKPEGLSARRLARFGAWLMPAPVLIGLAMLPMVMRMTQASMSMTATTQPTTTMIAAPLKLLTPAFWTLSAVSAVVSVFAFGIPPLALCRMFVTLMRRVPRPGLVRFARIEFWGLLIGGTILAAGYAWILAAIVMPMFTWMSTLGAAPPASATTTPPPTTATAPAGGPVRWTTVKPPGGPAITAAGGGAPPFAINAGFFASVGLVACGALAFMGFGIAGVVLLIMVYRALSSAAAEGERFLAAISTSGEPP